MPQETEPHKKRSLVYKYGTPHWADELFRRETPGGDQLWLAHRLRNDMVEAVKDADHRARRKDLYDATYADYVQDQGLGYGTHTGVLNRIMTSQDQVWRHRKKGVDSGLRFKRWDGSGTLRVQTQSNGKPLDVWSISGEGKRRVLHLRIRKRHPLGPLVLDIPFVMHRPLPDGALVSWIEVTRRAVAHNHRVTVSFTVTLPEVESKPVGDAADVVFRWTSDGNGGVKVAEVATGSGGLPEPPDDVAHLVTRGDWYEVWAHPHWRDLLKMYDDVRSGRDDELDHLREQVVPALKDEDLAEQVGFAAAQARKMGFAKYAALASRWPENHWLYPVLLSWREADKRLWRQEAHGRRHVIDARNDAYRKIAAWITEAVSRVVIHDVDIAELRADDGDDDPRSPHARRQIQFAAPAELKSAVENAAKQRGLRVRHV